MTQCDEILDYMKRGHTITPLVALNRFGCFRLAARVADLRRAGHNIVTTTVKVPSGKHITQYHIPAEHFELTMEVDGQ